MGVLRSWDQFGRLYQIWANKRLPLTHAIIVANLVLQDTIERIFAKDMYADIQRGIFLVRGENVLMLGEIVRLSRSTAV